MKIQRVEEGRNNIFTKIKNKPSEIVKDLIFVQEGSNIRNCERC